MFILFGGFGILVCIHVFENECHFEVMGCQWTLIAGFSVVASLIVLLPFVSSG